MIYSQTLIVLIVAALLCVHALSFSPSMSGVEISRKNFLQKSVATAGVVTASSFVSGQAASAAAIPAVGTPAPSFSLPSNAGKDISLSDLTKTGKYTVLYFYPGDFTSGCTIEANAFQRDFNEYTKLNTQIVGVSVDTVDKHLDFGKKYGLEFTLLSDQGGVVSEKYGSVLSIPFLGKFSNRQTYIISPEGQIVKVFTDVESKVAKHSQEVLVELKKIVA
mmetsp:Transcript_14128/g.18512  ORF Transcript_14128/g.18512 Transcript_14128/m.18512 type:complete len:220 (-) Transcript_14128:507-1166(-)|eukprot:CAMPEP_0117756518 /NCGR_PEP_ID=MMETSP0947-20121206/14130_1 /TAXON_ID=44440 /ORGANISM="Chattonella subsalsa, Strain CCMP2191" /LENGTH=219 /DNA_ID=CAMNT_0005576129 /DNA_START=106 /DNA_END=765 /DNA_ORIENTATION=-